MKTIFLIILAQITFISFGQELVWANQIGNSADEDEMIYIESASDGSVYLAGVFNGSPEFLGISLSMTSNGGYDIIIMKLDFQGNLIWAKQIGGAGDEYLGGGAIDQFGNLHITGKFSQTVDFDPNSGSTQFVANGGGGDIFIAKYDNSGALLWADQIGNFNYAEGNDIALDASGNVYSTGKFAGNMDFDPASGGNISTMTTSSNADFNAYVLKLDASGSLVWHAQFAGINEQVGIGIAVDSDYNVFTTGTFVSAADFDPGSGTYDIFTVNGGPDIFVSKLNPQGQFLWAKGMGDALNGQKPNDIEIDNSGNVITVGKFAGTVNFDPGGSGFPLTSDGLNDIFVLKNQNDGTFVWAKKMGGSGDDEARSLCIGFENSIYTSGTFEGMADFDPSVSLFELLTSQALTDGFISRLDSNGIFHFVKQIECTGEVSANDIDIDNSESIFNAGSFSSTADFDPSLMSSFNLASGGGNDGFALKLCQEVNSSLSVSSCHNYSSPSGLYTWSNSGVYQDTLQNILGCDSILTISLTILNFTAPLSVSQNNFTVSADASGLQYQWLDCDNNYSIITGETSQSFNPGFDGNYAVQLTDNNGCLDTSDCIQVEGMGIDDNSSLNLMVYPNPSDGSVYVQFDKILQDVQLTLLDAKGAVIEMITLNSVDGAIMDLPSASGVYMIVVRADNQEPIYQKIIKK